MSTLSDEAKEVITTVELINSHRKHIERVKNDLLRVDVLQERINQLTESLEKTGVTIERNGNDLTVLKHGLHMLHEQLKAEPITTDLAQQIGQIDRLIESKLMQVEKPRIKKRHTPKVQKAHYQFITRRKA